MTSVCHWILGSGSTLSQRYSSRFSAIYHKMWRGKRDTSRNITCSISFFSTFRIISRNFWFFWESENYTWAMTSKLTLSAAPWPAVGTRGAVSPDIPPAGSRQLVPVNSVSPAPAAECITADKIPASGFEEASFRYRYSYPLGTDYSFPLGTEIPIP